MNGFDLGHFIWSSACVIPNFLVILCMLFRSKLLVATSNKLVCSLLLTHILTSTTNIGRRVYPNDLYLYFSTTACIACTYLCLSVLSVERLLAIKHPFTYKRLLQWEPLMVTSPWIFSILYYVTVVIIVAVFKGKEALAKCRHISSSFLLALIVLCTTVLIISNFMIFKTAQEQIKKIASVFPQPRNESDREMDRTRRKAASQKQEIKAGLICVTLTLILVVFWMPMNAFRIQVLRGIWVQLLFDISIYLGQLNAFLDPLLYIALNVKLRKTILAFYCPRYRNELDMTEATAATEHRTTNDPIF